MTEHDFRNMNYDQIAETLERTTPEQIALMLHTWANTIEEQGLEAPVEMFCCALLREAAHRNQEIDDKLKEATESVMSRLTGIIRNAHKETTDERGESPS